jgi:hypothetical protein
MMAWLQVRAHAPVPGGGGHKSARQGYLVGESFDRKSISNSPS